VAACKEHIMASSGARRVELDPSTKEFYCRTLAVLTEAKIPFLVGGAYAFARYTGIERHTKDFDIFTRRDDCPRILDTLARTGYKTELTFPHWLGKAFCGGDFIDVIFSSGNGIVPVDDEWFDRAVDSVVLGMPAKLCPPEEILWSKAFIMERERFDGADVAHLLYACAEKLDWPRLLRRFGERWHVLLSHLILFRFIYPAERDLIPEAVLGELLARLQAEMKTSAPAGRLCQGTILSREQYLFDTDLRGYEDARLKPRGNMTIEDVAHWTAAIGGER
jgi:hypothetical protein